jgi:hypothetical protein
MRKLVSQLVVAPAVMGLALVLFATSARGDWLIVPGQRIGEISIGMERAEVLRLLGAPEREDDLEYLTRDNPPQDQFKDTLRDDWITPLPISPRPEEVPGYFMADFVTIYFKGRRVIQIEVRAPRFKTGDGLSSASTAGEWRKHFPDYQETFRRFLHPSTGGIPAAKHFTALDDALKAGIAWRFASMGNLAPEPDPAFVEIVAVHASGTPIMVDPDGGSRFIWKDNPHRLGTDD